jgi:predicted ATPase
VPALILLKILERASHPMTSPNTGSSIQFGRVTVLPAQRRLLVDGEPVRLGARAFDVLHALMERQGELVSKRELLQRVWPGLFVADNNLEVHVCALRKVIGNAAIVTVPGRGYVFDGSFTLPELAPDPPPPAAPLRGRTGECAVLARLMSESRMVTVTGPGGIGKSRVVREVLATTGAPVARVELASLPPEVSVASSVARALDLEFAKPPTARQVARAAAHQRGTIVIENAEQLADQSAELADALAETSELCVICTAQVLLHSRCERVLRLAPLAVPCADRAPGAQVGPAVELLFDAVSAHNSRATFTDREVHDAAAICRHLDGNPLAIELAAARVEMLGLAGVRRRLGQRFQLLEGSPRGIAAGRQRSLLATMDWSWNLLTRVERDALAALARFQGRFTLGMAHRVLRARAADEWESMQMVEALVNKSTVLVDPGANTTFRIPESTRLYAQRWSALAGRQT